MINILKLRKLEKEKKAQEFLKAEVSEETPEEFKVLHDKTSEAVSEVNVPENISVAEIIEIPEKSDSAEDTDAAEKFRQDLIEQILNDETMITRAELQKEIEEQEKALPAEISVSEALEAERTSEPEKVADLKPKEVFIEENKEKNNSVEKFPAFQAKEQSRPEPSVKQDSKVVNKPSVFESRTEQKAKKANDSIIQLVGFTIGKEYYGIDINRIKEINRMTEITKVPRAPHFIEGVINLRGTVIPVINLRTKVRMPKKEYDKDTRIIIVELSGKTIGFIVDGVREVLRIPENLLDPPPALAVGKRAEYITSVAKLENDLVILMDPEKVLTNEETKAIIKN